MKANRLPFDPGPAGWSALLPADSGHAVLEHEINADFLVVGAGFAGLSAARRLVQLAPQSSIVLLEARRVAEGPAGRNSGFMIDLPHNLGSEDYAGQADNDKKQTALNREAIAFAIAAAQDYEMEPEAVVQSGKINAAATPQGSAHNRHYAAHLEELGETCELLDAQQMRSISGSSYYETGLFTPGTAMLQPALYVQRLAQGLARSGVKLFENSPVIGLERENGIWCATTKSGTVRAKKVIMAVNGHVESFGLFKRRLIHIYLYASMTRALTREELDRLGGEAVWGFTPADPMGTTVRKIAGTGGARIVVRNSITWAPDRRIAEMKHLDFAKAHDQSFSNRFPDLSGIDMEHRWGGQLCLSRNSVAAFGEQDEGLFSACCQNGLGTAMGTLSGMAAAERALDHDTARVAFFEHQERPEKLPPEPFATLGARALFKWREWKAGREL